MLLSIVAELVMAVTSTASNTAHFTPFLLWCFVVLQYLCHETSNLPHLGHVMPNISRYTSPLMSVSIQFLFPSLQMWQSSLFTSHLQPRSVITLATVELDTPAPESIFLIDSQTDVGTDDVGADGVVVEGSVVVCVTFLPPS